MSDGLWSNATLLVDSLVQLATLNKSTDDDAEPKCTPFLYGGKLGSKRNQSAKTIDFHFFLESCKFVKDNLDSCEGGGYVLWTEMILCESDDLRRVIFIVLAVLALLYLFIMISTSADDFFSTNIANIVDEHNISQVSFASW
jgi:hypothetical protein